jgi:4-hydroxybenzoate polyprenyltransferase
MKLAGRRLSYGGPTFSGGSQYLESWTNAATDAHPTSTPIDHPTGGSAAPSVAMRLQGMLVCGRPHQWSKNTLVFVPAVLAGAINSSHALIATSLCFVALCLIASGTYIINDVLDVADDRKHWSKRHRPIASGALPISTAMVAAPLAIVSGLAIGFAVSGLAAATLCAYLVLTLAYSLGLKRLPVLDVTTLAALFTLRLVLGIVSADVQGSPWLLTFSMFLFGSLCLAKRYVEVEGAAARGRSTLSNRGYQVEDIPILIALGLATGTASVVIMVLYIIFDAFQRSFYGNTTWLWAFPVILFLWISRVWILAVRRQLNDDPVAFAVTDLPSIALGGTMLIAFILAWSGTFA